MGVGRSRWEVFVLEGVLARPTYHTKGLVKRRVILDASLQWVWNGMNVKVLTDHVRRQGLTVEAVTFTSQEVADEAADYFNRYDIPVFSTRYMTFDAFTDMLKYHIFEITHVYDSDQERIQFYGQMGSMLPGEV